MLANMLASVSILRRAYSTSTVYVLSKKRATAISQAGSTPLKVRERRAKAMQDATKSGEPISRGERRRLTRPFVGLDGRRHIRGTRRIKGSDSSVEEKIVGQRIYLPNIIFEMVRNHTPPGKAYNPYEATFRVPPTVTKTDIRSYLHAVYGVLCTYIRTDNYLPEMDRMASKRRKQKSAYKRAVVGLVEPFYYPQAVEDMNGRDRWLREQTLEELFKIKFRKETERNIMIKLTQKSSDSWSLRGQQWESRAKILRNILRRKEEREAKTRETAAMLLRGKLRSAEKVSSSESS